MAIEHTSALVAALAAVRTLEKMGYTHEGGELWKPPLGSAPAFTKPHTEWERGDVLRVVGVDSGDPFKVGDRVTHADVRGDPDPYVVCPEAPDAERWAMTFSQLEFVRRPE